MTEEAPKRTIPEWRRNALRKALDEGPRHAQTGDPAFADLKQLELFFTHSEITWLCNQALYQFDYQRAYHRKRAAKKKEERKEERSKFFQDRARAPQSLEHESVVLQRFKTAMDTEKMNQQIEERLLEALAPDLVPTVEELEQERRLDEAFARSATQRPTETEPNKGE